MAKCLVALFRIGVEALKSGGPILLYLNVSSATLCIHRPTFLTEYSLLTT